MNKKVLGIIFLTISVLLFLFSMSRLVTGSIIDTSGRWTYQSNYSAAVLTKKDPSVGIENVRTYIATHPEFQAYLFDEDFINANKNNPETMNKRALEIASTLGFDKDEDSSFYGDYHHQTNDIYYLAEGFIIIQVPETADYYYMVNVAQDQEITGDFIWTLEDSNGQTQFEVTDINHSSQGKVTLEPGLYYLYDTYDQLNDIAIKIQLTKR